MRSTLDLDLITFEIQTIMADLPSPSAGGSSGDELEDLLLAELEAEDELSPAPVETKQKEAPVPKRQKTAGRFFSLLLFVYTTF